MTAYGSRNLPGSYKIIIILDELGGMRSVGDSSDNALVETVVGNRARVDGRKD